MYQPLPRKYRPQVFKAVVGQEAIVTTLKNALKFERVAHAYLFCGSRGTGKTTLARVFAKALNCQQLTADFEPCNACPSCLEITSGRSLDVLEIDGASNRGIDDIRQINETVGYASSSGKYKIYIIDEVHMLTKEAFNALLKTLEEPPPNVKFFFATTEPHKVLPTIISRCQRFDLNRIPADQIVQKLREIGQDLKVDIKDDALELIAHLAEGGLRDAESLLDQLICYADGPITYERIAQTLGLSPRSAFFQLDKAIASDDHAFAFQLAGEVFSTGKDISCFLEGLLEHFRTLLVLKLNQPLSSYLNENDKKSYLESSRLYTEEQCLYMLDYLIQWHKELSRTPFKRVSLEMILLHLIRSKKRISITTLVRRLHELEEGHTAVVKKEEPKASSDLEEKLLNVLKAASPTPKPNIAPKEVIRETPVPAPKAQEILIQRPEPVIALLKKEEVVIEESKQPEPVMAPVKKQEVVIEEIKLPEPVVAPVKKEEAIPIAASDLNVHPSRYDTLLRFAAVELEGVVKRD